MPDLILPSSESFVAPVAAASVVVTTTVFNPDAVCVIELISVSSPSAVIIPVLPLSTISASFIVKIPLLESLASMPSEFKLLTSPPSVVLPSIERL